MKPKLEHPTANVKTVTVKIPLLCVSLLILPSPLLAQQPLPREPWGAPPVTVSHADGQWTLAGRKQTVILHESDLALEVRAGPARWAMVPSGAGDLLVKAGGKEFALRLADAGKIAITNYDTGFRTGVKITLGEWRPPQPGCAGANVDLTLFLTVGLEGQEEELVEP